MEIKEEPKNRNRVHNKFLHNKLKVYETLKST